MLAKSGLLSQRERLPTVCLAFVLRPRGFRSHGGQLRLEAGGRPTQHLWFREVCLWEVKPDAWWDKVPGLMALYPLCRHGRTPHDAVRHAAEAIAQTVTAQGERDDQLFLLDIFGELAYPRLDVERIIGSNIMAWEPKIVRKHRKAGQVEALQGALLVVIRNRYGPAVGTELTAAVQAVDDPEVLTRLLERASVGTDVDELRSGFRAPA